MASMKDEVETEVGRTVPWTYKTALTPAFHLIASPSSHSHHPQQNYPDDLDSLLPSLLISLPPHPTRHVSHVSRCVCSGAVRHGHRLTVHRLAYPVFRRWKMSTIHQA